MSEQPRQDAALLLRRAGFTGTATEIDAAVARGYDATVDLLVAPAAADRRGARNARRPARTGPRRPFSSPPGGSRG